MIKTCTDVLVSVSQSVERSGNSPLSLLLTADPPVNCEAPDRRKTDASLDADTEGHAEVVKLLALKGSVDVEIERGPTKERVRHIGVDTPEQNAEVDGRCF